MRNLLSAGILALVLAAPAAAQAQPVDGARPLPSMEQRTAAFGEIDAAMQSGDKLHAADLLLALSQDPAQQVFHAEVWARLGAILDEQGYPHAALSAYARALQTDANGVSSVAKDALRLADQVHDTALLQPVFARNVGIDVDAATRGRIAYLAARNAHAQQSYATAVAFLKMVPADSPDYADAKALEGVVLSHTSHYAEAVAALQVAAAAGAGRPDAERFSTLMNMDIGRAYFGDGDFVRASEYFSKIARSSPQWPEAQFERAWAHFRLDDLNGALSLLSVHSSPFFANEYYPEAALLEVYSLFLLCKFPAAGTGIDAFQARFTPMLEEIKTVGALDAPALFQQTRATVIDGKPGKLPPMVLRSFQDEARFQDAVVSVDQIDQELSRMGKASGSWADQARTWLQTRRADIIQAEGGRVRDRARAMEDELGAMLSNVELNKLDIMQMESHMYERASYTGVMEKANRTADRQVRTKKGYLLWPYEGEVWADEVGWLRIDTKAECPESLRKGDE